ncbi:MAG: hypothetical protein OSJ62_12860 [Lachnospiraceae bacterium]|nr:hypothetical protein [Lachnospiraceae bacterium]
MDSNIFKLLNEVMPTTENKNEVYNIIIPLILSKKIFKNSKELKEFVENILEFKIADYAYKSRTILLGKVIKFIAELELSASIELNKNLTTFLEDTIEINSKKKEEKKSSKNHSESLFQTWNNYIKSR